MERELIIPRKKSKSVKYSIGMFLIMLLFALPITDCLFDFAWITSEMPLFLTIISVPCVFLFFFGFVFYFKEIFNSNPILTINSRGICEQTSKRSVGLIKWEHIEKINIVPSANHVYFICIILKQPEIYIDNVKLLEKLEKQKATKTWGHVCFTSLYFKKEFQEVIDIMRYYYKINSQFTQP